LVSESLSTKKYCDRVNDRQLKLEL